LQKTWTPFSNGVTTSYEAVNFDETVKGQKHLSLAVGPKKATDQLPIPTPTPNSEFRLL